MARLALEMSRPERSWGLDDEIDSFGFGAPSQTLAMNAATEGLPRALKALLDAGADPNHAIGRASALSDAACAGQLLCAKLLIERGAFVDGPDGAPLILAALAGHVDCCLLLLDAGADTSRLDHEGFTPAMAARLFNTPSSLAAADAIDAWSQARALRQTLSPRPPWRPSPPKRYDCSMSAPLPHDAAGAPHQAIARPCPELVDLYALLCLGAEDEFLSRFQTELARGLPGWSLGDKVSTPKVLADSLLSRAAAGGFDRALLALLDAGADPNQDVLGLQSPLGKAAGQGRLSCLRILLSRGARPDLLSRPVETPLSAAARVGSVECCLALLEAGADPSARCCFGRSASQSARAMGSFDAANAIDAWARAANCRAELLNALPNINPSRPADAL